jgi:DNA-binding SARP family transcriptional activator/DNA-binding transcriptional ArsR family regulator
MHDLKIRLFGALEVVRDERPPERPETNRVLSLLGYLIAQRGVPQHREKLAELLWPDQAPQRGRRLLSDALWRLRRLLPESASGAPLALVGDTITFQASPSVWLDLAEFERLAPGPDLEQMQAAANLYRGDFLEDCYDDWAIYERERLRARYVALLEQLLARYKQQGAHEPALQVALLLVRHDELREDAHRELMWLYQQLGRQADALRAYERCQALLREELGAEPAPETQALYKQLIAPRAGRQGDEPGAGDGTLAGEPSTQGDAPFVGRRDERAALLQALEVAIAGEGGVVLVAGDPGQGKSRLLHEIAEGANWRGAQVSWGRGDEGAQSVPLMPLRAALAEMLTPLRARQLATTLDPIYIGELVALLPELTDVLAGVPPRAPLDPAHQQQRLFTAILQTVQALCRITPQTIVLEDLHWFDRTSLELLEALLPRLRHDRILVLLSGRSEELPRRPQIWEMLLRLDHAGLLRRLDLAGLSRGESDELLRRSLRPAELPERLLARIHEATGGNPYFAIEMRRTLQEQGLLVRDSRGLWQLQGGEAAVERLPLPASLRDVIETRVQTLSSHDRQALATAAVLGQRFSPELWARVNTGGAEQASVLRDALPPPELLARRFLIEEHDGYQFNHSLLREVVYQALDDSERRQLHLRAAEALEREHVARVEALAQHLILAGAWAKALPYLIQAGDHARDICAYGDALRAYDQALDVMRQGTALRLAPTIWSLQLKRGQICVLLGSYQAALAAYADVLRLVEQAYANEHPFQQSQRRGTRIQALNGLCHVYGLRNDYARAQEVSQQALALLAEGAEPSERADTLFHAGLICFRQDEYQRAEQHLHEALTLYESIGAPEVQARLARCLDTLVQCWVQREGVTDRALDGEEQALAIVRALGDKQGERECLLSLSNLYLLRGRFTSALHSAEAVLRFFREADAREKIAQCQYLRGAALYRLGHAEESSVALGEALTLCQELERAAAAQFVQLYLGRALSALGRFDEAAATIAQAAASADRLVRTRALCALAELGLEQNEPQRAFALAAEALGLVRQIGARPVLGRALQVLGRIRASDTQGLLPPPSELLPATATCFQESALLFEEAHYEGDLGETLAFYGIWLLGAGRLDEARQALEQADSLCARCEMAGVQAELRQHLERLGRLVAERRGVIEVLLARHDAPRGRPLQTHELVAVAWTVEAAEDAEALRRGGKVGQRQMRLRRLCAEAGAHGAEPTVADLAEALGVTVRTVSRDLAALRKAGELLPTRGSLAAEQNP